MRLVLALVFPVLYAYNLMQTKAAIRLCSKIDIF